MVAGGGGGYSSFEPVPLYQEMLAQQGAANAGSYSAVQYLTPTDYGTVDGLYLPTQWTFAAAPTVEQGEGTGRGLPDLAVDADPFTGYLLYDPLASPTLQGGWGGTSFGAPQLNGAAALIDQAVGHRTGLWNPAIYGFAISAQLAVHPAVRPGHEQRQPLLHRDAGPGLQPRLGPGLPGPGQAGGRLRVTARIEPGPGRGAVGTDREMPDT